MLQTLRHSFSWQQFPNPASFRPPAMLPLASPNLKLTQFYTIEAKKAPTGCVKVIANAVLCRELGTLRLWASQSAIAMRQLSVWPILNRRRRPLRRNVSANWTTNSRLWLASAPSTHHSHHLSPPHPFIPGLKPPLSANPSIVSFFFFFRVDSTDSLDCIPILLSFSVFTF